MLRQGRPFSLHSSSIDAECGKKIKHFPRLLTAGRYVVSLWLDFDAQHVRPPGFCCGWPDGLELSPGHSPRSRRYYGQFQALVDKHVCFQRTSAINTTRCTNLHLIYLLTYLHVCLVLVLGHCPQCPC